MAEVSCFQPYEFSEGEKIYISGGKRKGDWLVAGVEGSSVTLRCPVSHKEFTWQNFCYLVAKKEQPWPGQD